MTFRGMIFQYNSEMETGLIMLADGEKKNFSIHNWSDEATSPKIGLEVLYNASTDPVTIKALSAQEKTKFVEEEKKAKAAPADPTISKEAAKEPTPIFDTMQEYIDYYKDKGFNLARDSVNSGTRTASFRKYEMGDFEEVVLVETDVKISITKLLNGKEVD